MDPAPTVKINGKPRTTNSLPHQGDIERKATDSSRARASTGTIVNVAKASQSEDEQRVKQARPRASIRRREVGRIRTARTITAITITIAITTTIIVDGHHIKHLIFTTIEPLLPRRHSVTTDNTHKPTRRRQPTRR